MSLKTISKYRHFTPFKRNTRSYIVQYTEPLICHSVSNRLHDADNTKRAYFKTDTHTFSIASPLKTQFTWKFQQPKIKWQWKPKIFRIMTRWQRCGHLLHVRAKGEENNDDDGGSGDGDGDIFVSKTSMQFCFATSHELFTLWSA